MVEQKLVLMNDHDAGDSNGAAGESPSSQEALDLRAEERETDVNVEAHVRFSRIHCRNIPLAVSP